MLVAACVSQLPEELPDGLTRREAEILSMIARGATNPAIAAGLLPPEQRGHLAERGSLTSATPPPSTACLARCPGLWRPGST